MSLQKPSEPSNHGAHSKQVPPPWRILLWLEIAMGGLWLWVMLHEQFPPQGACPLLASWLLVAAPTAILAGVGGLFGLLGLELWFSLALVDLYIIHLTGVIDYPVLEAIAGSGEAHHYRWWLVGAFTIMGALAWLGRRRLARSWSLVVVGLLLSALGVSLLVQGTSTDNDWLPRLRRSWSSGHVCVALNGIPQPPCHSLNEPDTYWKFGRAVHDLLANPLGDGLGVALMTLDPGRNSAPLGHHAIPEEITGHSVLPVHHLIIVIGESAMRDRMGAYGWTVPTTPALSADISHGQACLVSNTHAVAPATRWAVLPSLSFWRPDMQANVMEKRNLVELAHNQGMKTAFLTVQQETGVYSGMIGYVANHADVLFDLGDNLYHDPDHVLANVQHPATRQDFGKVDTSTFDDDTLLAPYLHLQGQWSGHAQLYVFHLEGSHFPYAHRYQAADRVALPHATDYERSLHHTDALLERINQAAHKAWGDDYVLFYSSDHGEDLKLHAHAMLYGHQQYWAPVVIYGPQSRQWCQEAEKLRQQNGFYSTNMNKYLLSKIMGYEVDPKAIERDREHDRIWRMEQADDYENLTDHP
ncbi:sulfatase-like hydrolase/transferase [Formicincola oecophyllae]|uniref:Sulfatase-like hydrolase/transferase n=1 Tax=Formicincola oecophyllae TaxID=2558361 RepID=A0A4Y6U7V5_9PROT|nr:sulfatase-like hydrolase/transferase [Formicincola oecophyllae]QDH13513.1 sulfatase-like hydrolase/transferase [Formicincola oecophyllae]